MTLRVLFNRMIPSFIKFRAPRVDGMLPAMQTKLVALIYRTHTNAQSFPILGPCCKGNTPSNTYQILPRSNKLILCASIGIVRFESFVAKQSNTNGGVKKNAFYRSKLYVKGQLISKGLFLIRLLRLGQKSLNNVFVDCTL